MARINTSDLEPGMILAEDLRSPQGRLLLPAGRGLTVEHIRTCKAWGIIEAEISNFTREEAEDPAGKDIPPEVLDACRQIARERFCEAEPEFPAQHELMRQFLLRTARILARSPGVPLAAAPAAEQTGSAPAFAKHLRTPPEPERIITGRTSLASLPEVYARIIDTLNDPCCSSAHIAEVVSRDSSLAARLLRLVNSPFYGFVGQVDSLTRAVTLVGSNPLMTLAVGVSVITLFDNVPAALMTMRDFWRHSIACGLAARHLAERVPGLDGESCFSAALMHDLGRLVMLLDHPLHCRAAFALALGDRRPLFAAERDLWGFDHAAVSAALLKAWNLPEGMVAAVAGHHPNHRLTLQGAALHVADAVAHILDTDVRKPGRIPPLDRRAWEMLGLPRSVLASAVNLAESQLEDVMALFMDA